MIETKMKELLGLAYTYNSEYFTLFVDYSGHVNLLEVNIHYGGWKRDISSDVCLRTYLDTENAAERLDEIMREVEEAYLLNEEKVKEIEAELSEKEEAISKALNLGLSLDELKLLGVDND